MFSQQNNIDKICHSFKKLEYHRIGNFIYKIDFRKPDFLSEEKINECSRFVNKDVLQSCVYHAQMVQFFYNMCRDNTDVKAMDCGVGCPRFKSWRGMIFSTNNSIFVLHRLISVFLVQVYTMPYCSMQQSIRCIKPLQYTLKLLVKIYS